MYGVKKKTLNGRTESIDWLNNHRKRKWNCYAL